MDADSENWKNDALPMNEKNGKDFFKKVSGYWLLHEHDGIPLLKKIEKCAAEIGLNKDNLFHIHFIAITFSQTYYNVEGMEAAFDNEMQRQRDLKQNFGQEFQ